MASDLTHGTTHFLYHHSQSPTATGAKLNQNRGIQPKNKGQMVSGLPPTPEFFRLPHNPGVPGTVEPVEGD